MIERILLNLSILVAMCVFSGFVMDNWSFKTKKRFWAQGFLFGLVAIAGMLIPVKFGVGVIFDGRTVVLSLAAWYFGWRAAAVSGGMALGMRLLLGGSGTFPGSLVIVFAASIGLLFRKWVDPVRQKTTILQTLALAMVTHLGVLGLMAILLPPDTKDFFIGQMMMPMIVFYPLASLLVGFILMSQQENLRSEYNLRVALKEKDLVLKTAFSGYEMLDMDGYILDVNDALCEITGYSREELLGVKVTDFILDEDDESIKRTLAMIQSQGGCRFERKGYRKDGRLIQFDISTRAIDREGEIRICAFIQDITDVREQERLMRLQSAALEAAANRVVITDAAGKIEWANGAFTEGSGYELEEVLGREPGELLNSGKQDSEFYEKMWGTIQKGETWRGELTNRHKEGLLYQEEMTITPLYDLKGAITHYIAIKQDITDKKQMEEMFHRAQRMEGIGSLSSGIAHDLNNILSPIMMSADILKSALPEGPDREMAELILRSAARGAGIVQQLLSYARGAKGDKREVNPVLLFKEVMKMYRETFPPNIQLVDAVDRKLWQILADPSQLHQVLSNLLLNARDAIPESGGEIRLEAGNRQVDAEWAQAHPPATAGFFVRVAVVDNGCGMDEDTLEKIFDPFFTTKSEGQGTGIGLPTTLGLVKGHGGFLLVTSNPEVGSCFEVYLPAAESTGTGEASALVKSPGAVFGKEEHVLVVDDEKSVRIMLRASLLKLGYRVELAENGEKALARLEEGFKPDLILLDFMMPGMGGEGVLKELDQRGVRTPILIISGMLPESKITEGKVRGRSLLYKPFSVSQLSEHIQEILGES